MKSNARISVILMAAIILNAASYLNADSLLLKNGSILDGNIISQDQDSIVIKVGQAELKIPQSTIESKLKEADQEFRVRMARVYYDNRNFGQCISQLEELKKTGDSRILSIAIAEVKDIQKNYNKDGEEGVKRCTNHLTPLKAAAIFQKEHKYTEALNSIAEFMRQSNKAPEDASIDLVLEAASIASQALAQRLKVTPEQLEQLNSKANSITGIKNVTCNFDPEAWEIIKPFKSAEQLWAPLSHTQELPSSVEVLKKVYRDQNEVRTIILTADLLNRMKLPDDQVIHEPIIRQWYYFVKIIAKHQAAAKASRNALAREESAKILNSLADEWEANRVNELQRLANKIREMVKNEEWGYEMRFQINRIKFLKPGPDITSETASYYNKNEEQIIKIVSHMQKVNKSNSKRISYWDSFSKGQAIVGRIGSRRVLNN